MSARAIKDIDPTSLLPHPLNHLPRWQKDSDEWLAFITDIREHGIQVPIRVTQDGQVIDGETRRQAAIELRIPTIPAVIVTEDEAAAILIREIQHRRNLTKGQRAYLIVPALPYLAEARDRAASNLKQGTRRPEPAPTWSIEVYAQSLGFSRELLDQARRLHATFREDPELREEFEPRILSYDDPIGLGACLAGIAGRRATVDQEKHHRAHEQLELFRDAWGVVGKRLQYWTRLDDDDRRAVVPIIRQTVAAMPSDLRQELRRALATAEKEP